MRRVARASRGAELRGELVAGDEGRDGAGELGGGCAEGREARGEGGGGGGGLVGGERQVEEEGEGVAVLRVQARAAGGGVVAVEGRRGVPEVGVEGGFEAGGGGEPTGWSVFLVGGGGGGGVGRVLG